MRRSQKIMLFALMVILSVQVYMEMAQVIGFFRTNNVLKSFQVVGLKDSVSDRNFAAGDTVRLVAESDAANVYRFSIFGNSSLILEGSGRFNQSKAEALVSLSPPEFGVGQYSVTFDAWVYDSPLPGVQFYDSSSWLLDVSATGTKLSVNATYDTTLCTLQVHANLTSSDGSPVANENVDFRMRFSDRQRLTNGWVPLGSAETDANGSASYRCAFNMHNGKYSFMAYHGGNENYGESKNMSDVEIFLNQTLGEKMDSDYSAPLGVLDGGVSGNLTLEVSNASPYASLPTSATAKFVTDAPLEDLVAMIYFLNDSGDLRFVDSEQAHFKSGSSYEYDSWMRWEPPVSGSWSLVVGLANGDIDDMIRIAGGNLSGIICYQNTTLDIRPCPSNLVLQCPEAIYESTLLVTSGFFKPRPYGEDSSDFHLARALASNVTYDGLDYAVDDPIGSAQLKLYVNGTLSTNSTNNDGFALFPTSLNVSSNHFVLNLTATVDESVTLFDKKTVSQIVNCTQVHISDLQSGSDDFCFNLTVTGCNQTTDAFYIDTLNSVKADASLLGSRVWNAPVSFIVAKNNSRYYASTGFANVPYGSDYLRVFNAVLDTDQRVKILFNDSRSVSAYVDSQNCTAIPVGSKNLTLTVDPLKGDENGDHLVDIYDAIIFSGAYGSEPNDTSWNSVADINKDNVVDVFDAIILAGNYGKNDSISGLLEFLTLVNISETIATDNFGSAIKMWNATQLGCYLVQAKLPAELNVSLVSYRNVTALSAPLDRVSYCYVQKRPVNLIVDLPSDFCVKTVVADADEWVCNTTNSAFDPDVLLVGISDREFRSFVHFNVSSIPQDAHIISARLNLYDGLFTNTNDSFGVFNVTSGPWSEGFHWDDQPTCAGSPSCIFNVSGLASKDGWLFLDATSAARSWQQNSTGNFGLAVKILGAGNTTLIFYSRTTPKPPSLEIAYISPSPANVTVYALDDATNGPVSPALSLQFYKNGTWMGSATTDQSGLALLAWDSMSTLAYNWSVMSSETDLYLSASGSSVFDFRFPSNITSCDTNNTVHIYYVGSYRIFNFVLTSSSLFGLNNMTVKFYVNGTFFNGTSYSAPSYPYTNTSFCNGTVPFYWAAPENGTYSIRAVSEETTAYKPCETYVMATVRSKPVGILFSLSKQEVQPGDSLYLNATLIDPTTNTIVSSGYDFWMQFYATNSIGSTTTICDNHTTSGQTGVDILYPNDSKAYAYKAEVKSELINGTVNQGLGSTPVQLIVSKPTVLSLEVLRNLLSVKHTIQGHLTWGSQAVQSVTVKIMVNDTSYYVTTNSSGYFTLSLYLQCKNDNSTLYRIQASFEDKATAPVTASAFSQSMGGTNYTVCSTVQYGYKPVFNSTMLTVLPQSTETLIATNPEGIQKEMENDGSFSAWVGPGDSWWTWAKLHVRIHVEWLNFTTQTWIGFPFGAGVEEFEGLENIFVKAFEQVADPLISIYESTLVNTITTTTAVFVGGMAATTLSQFTPYYAVALATYSVAMAATIAGFYALADKELGRTVLLGMGGTLLGFVIGLYCLDPLFNLNNGLASASLSGTYAQVQAVKTIYNYFVSYGLKTVALAVGFGCWVFNTPFNVASFCLALLALSLASLKTW